jgi:hypothetical protein
MDSISPVLDGVKKDYEIVLGQGEGALAAVRSPEGLVVSRWTFTQEEREAIARGEDLYLSVLTFNHPFQMVKLTVGIPDENKSVENLRRVMRIDDDYELRKLHVDHARQKAMLDQMAKHVLDTNPDLKRMAADVERAERALTHKKAEVFTEKPKEEESKLVVVQ